MQIFLSHAAKDADLARILRSRLKAAGFSVWAPADEIFPGDNWAQKIAEALNDSEMMVILVTPRAFESESLRRNVQFVIGSEKYAERVFTVFVGPTTEARKDIPWILLRLPHRQIESPKEFRQVVKDIRQMSLAHA